MKHALAPMVLLIALVLAACAPGSFGVDISRDLAPQTIPGDPAARAAAQALGEFGSAPAMNFASNVDAIDGSVASGFYLRDLTLTIDSSADPAGTTSCWEFVHTVAVYVESTVAGSELPRVRVAQTSNPGCTDVMRLAPIEGIDLKPYADGGFRLTIEATGLPPDHNITFGTHLVFRAAVLS